MPITPLPPADYEPEYSGANFSQNMGQYNHPGTFRFWCQKVLPLVYDDSLSYYELLCKVVDYLNKTMEDVNTAAQDVDDLNNAFNSLQQYTNDTFDEFKSVYDELQTYVNTYFSGLDVQEEIDNKLDAMAANGTLTELISPFIPSLVSNWLATNITPTTPAVDKTLSISGAAADSLVVGNKTNELFNDLKTLAGNNYYTDWNDNYACLTNTQDPVVLDPLTYLSAFTCQIIDCTAGDVFSITGKSDNTAYRVYAWLREDLTVGYQIGNHADLTDEIIIAPDYASKLVVNTFQAVPHQIIKITSGDALKSSYVILNSAAKFVGIFTDANTLPTNSVVAVNNADYLPSHLPDAIYLENMTGGIVEILTFNYTPKQVGGTVQLLLTPYSAWYRIASSNTFWRPWKQIDNIIKAETYNFPILSLFETIGVVGDSWASGEITINGAASSALDKFNISWPQIAARMYGITATNFSHGGLTTRRWLTHARGLQLLNSESAKNLYICALGINDSANPSANPIGNTGDMETGADTFYGNYGTIIKAIKTKAPDAMIAISTIPQYNESANIGPYNTAIRNLATHFSIQLLDIDTDEFFTGSYFNSNLFYNHPTAPIYAGMAEAYNRLIATACVNNPTYWNTYESSRE